MIDPSSRVIYIYIYNIRIVYLMFHLKQSERIAEEDNLHADSEIDLIRSIHELKDHYVMRVNNGCIL